MMASRRAYLRQPVARYPVRDAIEELVGARERAIGGVLRAVPAGAARAGIMGSTGGAAAIPDTLIDNYEEILYEDQGLTLSDRYGGDTSNFDRQQSTVYSGDYALQASADGFISQSNRTVEQGDTFERYIYLGGGGASFWYGTQADGTENGYAVYLLAGQNRVRLREYDSGSLSQLYSSEDESNFSSQTFYRLEIFWDGSTHKFILEETDGTEIDSGSGTSSLYTSGGTGMKEYSSGGSVDDEVRII